MQKAKAAILYDFLQVKGGAEAVTLDLCRHFSHLDLVTAFVNRKVFTESPLSAERLHTLTSQTELQGWQTLKSCLAFQHRTGFLKEYDTLIFSGSNAPLAVVNSQARQNIYYCHTPPRFVYDLKAHYLNSIPAWQRPMLKSLIHYLQPRYEVALGRMDKIFANSKNVQQRLKHHLGVESEVLYPLCRIDRFRWIGQGDYFLSTARLEEYKRVELIVRAFMQMPDKKLIVTSGGSQLNKLKALAQNAANIQFTGWVSEAQLAGLVGNCLATIYIPMDEDFGMSPVESMGAEKPVIGVNEGGVKETVIDGETGWLLPANPTNTQLIDCISSVQYYRLGQMREHCQKQAASFSSGRFFSAFDRYL
ncbi:glycosyltransferase [Bowmanella denitrificans]|uniref:Glycosyltransferase n=1 Tax=Bowmanella denitrificans TaxID=366582 RepID=A0ABP3GVW3_9ALTE